MAETPEFEMPKHWMRDETIGPREVAKLFNVATRTVTKWADSGMIGFFRTPSGVRRYPVSEVQRVMAGTPPEDPQLLVGLARMDREKYHKLWLAGWRNGFAAPEQDADDDT